MRGGGFEGVRGERRKRCTRERDGRRRRARLPLDWRPRRLGRSRPAESPVADVLAAGVGWARRNGVRTGTRGARRPVTLPQGAEGCPRRVGVGGAVAAAAAVTMVAVATAIVAIAAAAAVRAVSLPPPARRGAPPPVAVGAPLRQAAGGTNGGGVCLLVLPPRRSPPCPPSLCTAGCGRSGSRTYVPCLGAAVSPLLHSSTACIKVIDTDHETRPHTRASRGAPLCVHTQRSHPHLPSSPPLPPSPYLLWVGGRPPPFAAEDSGATLATAAQHKVVTVTTPSTPPPPVTTNGAPKIS